MSSAQQLFRGIAGFVLLGIYSWTMIASSGSAGSWAWVILVAGVALLGTTARSVAIQRAGSRDDG